MNRGSLGIKTAQDALIVGLYLTVGELNARPSSGTSTEAFLNRLQYRLQKLSEGEKPSIHPMLQADTDGLYRGFRYLALNQEMPS